MAAIMKATEQDFTDLAEAAQLALDSGDRELAMRLDILARKANANISNRKFAPIKRLCRGNNISWREVPSTFI